MSVAKTDCNDWDTYKNLVTEFCQGNHPYKTFVTDSIDAAVLLYESYICKKENADSVNEIGGGWGKGKGRVELEFFRIIKKLTSSNYGLIFLSHVEYRDVTVNNKSVTKIHPNLPDVVSTFLLSQCDINMFGEVDRATKKHVLRTRPGADYKAKDRYGILPETIDFSYDAFLKAYKEGGRKKFGTTTTKNDQEQAEEPKTDSSDPTEKEVDTSVRRENYAGNTFAC